jgi:hypothetical protein
MHRESKATAKFYDARKGASHSCLEGAAFVTGAWRKKEVINTLPLNKNPLLGIS